jgi:hypothetical protein
MICTMCGETSEEMSFAEAWVNRALDLWNDETQNVCVGCAEKRKQQWADEDEANAHRPEEERVCFECHETGMDKHGYYPSLFDLRYKHAVCTDWDDVNKYGNDYRENA